MESSDETHNKIVVMKQSFFDEGYLIPTQFQQLEMLQDSDDMNFVRDVFCLFFTDMTRQFAEIEQNLGQEIDGKQREDLIRFLHRLKGSVLSIGALKILNGVNKMIQFFEEENMEGIMDAFEQVKMENANLRVKVEPYFKKKEIRGYCGFMQIYCD
ncbi:pseudo histidine-containing phosphotransfer protein 2-like isoform X2 [Cajanus cajan]|uniref:pseudo histidine-containing phosphotransfer protein 2-like isoform X2 n=1 Tax=Cajanus cajan TaxID=3821 RepID=UPI00098D8FCB|nr:pseudo histidine-containing phosphotransfer protein 2-like isoform X2 [Cajanus cajan]